MIAAPLLPPGGDPARWLTPVSVSANIASPKWGRDRFARQLLQNYPGVTDYRYHPSEDYAHAIFEFTNGDGEPVVVECTTSWSFVGAGLRLSFELLGPEYSTRSDTLDTESKVFFSRRLEQGPGEDMVEKQPAESLANGLQVVRLLIAASHSEETGHAVKLSDDFVGFTPAIVKGTWNPRSS